MEVENETMRMMHSPTESPFPTNTQDTDLSPVSVNLDIIETPIASNKRKKPEMGLNQLIHGEAEVLGDLFEQDNAVKRLTVQQRKDLNSAYD